MTRPDNARIAELFDATAPRYDRQIRLSERRLLGNPRKWAVGHASGRVLEIAVGTGLNLPLYSPDVTAVTGIDLSSGMLAHAQQRIADHGLAHCEVRRGDAQALDLEDESVDTVVSTLSYCTIPDPAAACAEAMRVLVPQGRFVLVEHGPSTNRLLTRIMRAIEPLTLKFMADNLVRDPVPYLEDAGFVIDTVDRTGLRGICFRILAHKPG
ncbi:MULTISPECIES: methyltransferase domain-containing protein [unclassified Rhodococcus (in: high G+C Gram-positive bacteria)]|uniref:class I SAM-dependent methyltransferase n=1 Tax=Rhodococcus sp. SJ-3 TaxID=3454628 RepID=UPI003F7A1FE8